MRTRFIIATAVAAVVLATTAGCGGTGAANTGGDSVTVYSADGLGSWYKDRFAAFTKQTGTTVQIVEAGSAEVVSRVDKEKSNPQADVIVTLPPFIQKAASQDLLAPLGIDTAGVPAESVDADGKYVSVINNYLSFIANPAAQPVPKTWDDLLSPEYKGKLQYSTPGQAGDGTAVLLLLQHVMGKQGALDYLGALQKNNVGPSSSTGKLQPKVSNGELLFANGDVQMNLASIQDDKSNFSIVFPADASGKATTVALPYVMGLTKTAPHADSGKKLMEFLLSEDSQKTVADGALGASVRPSIASASAGPVTAALGTTAVWQPNWNDVLTDLDADVAAYNKAVGN